MHAFRFRTACVAVVAAFGVSACVTDYGYGGLSVGVGSPSYGYSGYP